jgi:hypothetical protein
MDGAVYVRFSHADAGTKMVATRGYNGDVIAYLYFDRVLSDHEEHDLDHAVRRGARETHHHG